MLSKLRSLPDTIRGLPGALRDRMPELPSLPLPDLGDRLPDAETIERGGTILAAAGGALAAVGLLVRVLIRRRRADGEEPSEATMVVDVTAVEPTPEPTAGLQIAPLVGMVGLIVMRLVVERLRGENAMGAGQVPSPIRGRRRVRS